MAVDFSSLSKIIEQVGKDKGIDRQVVIDAVVQGMLVAARKKYGTYREIEAQYNEESGDVELYEFKEVVTDEEFIDEEIEIKLSEALALDPEAQLNDSIGAKLDSSELGRIAAQMAKQIITQKVRDAERDIIFSEFESRKGEIASGIARRVERRNIVVDLGKIEAHIPPREQIPGEMFRPGDRVQGFIRDVRQTNRGPQIIMTRGGEDYVRKLFEIEVPEIYDGIIEINAVAREPGQRAKVAVSSKDPSVDAQGACIGMKGSRVQNIVQELSGEKIDIVVWDEDPARFVCNALQPAEIAKVYLNEESREMEVIVPDHQLSLAIGKKGQNVRLAAKLTGWRLDIVSESAMSQKTAESIFNLMLLPDMNETMAQNIFQSGFNSFQDIASAPIGEVQMIPGYDSAESAQELIDRAKSLITDYEAKGEEVPKAPEVKVSTENVTLTSLRAKESADEMLQRELAALNNESASDEAKSEEATSEEVKSEEMSAAPVSEETIEEDIVAPAPVEEQVSVEAVVEVAAKEVAEAEKQD